MMVKNVDTYLINGCRRCSLGGTPECKVHFWTKELELLRSIALDCGMHEEIKWSVPVYTHLGKNILIISAFKDYCAVSFFKGSLLADSYKLLIQQTENIQESRQLRFTTSEQIIEIEQIIRSYIFEAIEIEKAGLKIEPKKTSEFKIPVELQHKFDADSAFKIAFESLTPGRQKGYLLFFNGAKQSATRVTRIEKWVDAILKGKGMND